MERGREKGGIRDEKERGNNLCATMQCQGDVILYWVMGEGAVKG